ncbi:hypothetical protein TNCV_3848111 [Trichonephila clavipes]|uniref:Uncharacterized protein n=1 Tax=Trichonephila clavipes TaxID=2585209 RepID=A0A8X6R898_TRICX|nr:hypothetical protein TNCV_3848111 [Trichonephila clavipes]
MQIKRSCHLIDNVIPKPTKVIVGRAARPLDRSLEHHANDSTFYLNFEEEHLRGWSEGLPLLLPCHQPLNTTFDSSNI